MAGTTYLEKFNFYLHTFLKEITTIIPEFSDNLTENYGDILENSSLNDDKYVKEYMTAIEKYHSEIASKNDKLFKGEKSVFILRNIDFRELWSKDLSDNTRENVWKYLQTLYVLGRKIVADDEDVTRMLDELNNSDREALEKHQREMMDMINNMSPL